VNPINPSPLNKKTSKDTVYYPVFLDIHGKKSIVIGGGTVAIRKVKMLLEGGGKVTVISPKPHPDIARLSKERAIRLIRREYEAGDLKGAVIAIACTDAKEINRGVAHDAKKAGVLVNIADDPKPSDFIIPSFFRQGGLTVAVSTSGISPALARKIRTTLQKSFGEEYASLLSLIGEVRSTLKKKENRVDPETWQEALDLDLLIQLVRSGQKKKAQTILLSKLQTHKNKK
jgi:precorrin-2 dehydrogenase/sirohydrochlorin ferrochelatase